MLRILIAISVLCSATALAADVAPYHPPAKRVSPLDGFLAQISKIPATTPRMADGHPDLNGMWTAPFPAPFGRFSRRSLQTLEPDQATMQRANAWNKPIYKPEYWQKVHENDFSKVDVDPAFNCLPLGVPRMGAPRKIVQTGGELIAYNGGFSGATVRFIPTDGRARDKGDFDYDNYQGVPLGRWDGDTFVIESVGFNDISWLQWQGYFHTSDMKVTERLTRHGDYLFYQFIVDDPKVLAEPWTSSTFVRRLNPNRAMRVEEIAPCKEQDIKLIADPYFRG